MTTAFSALSVHLRYLEDRRIAGRVRAVNGLSLVAGGLDRVVGVGQRVTVLGRLGGVPGEVVGIAADAGTGVTILPFGTWEGVAAGDEVVVAPEAGTIAPDAGWIGHVVDALGQPLSGSAPSFEGLVARRVRGDPPPPLERRRVGPKLETGVKCLDIFAPLCRGQRLGIFAGSGVGKSTLMAMLARQCEADVIVIGLVGERGREVQDFIEDDLGPAGMARSVVVAATSDQPPLMRRQAAWTATALAEHFRDEGAHVLLMIDSVTRFAMAQREIGLAAGEPPTTKGYPPTVFSELPRLLERAGPGARSGGDITALYTVLVDGDDHDEPVADTVRGILDGHVVLDRKVAERGRFPAMDLQRSVSRMLPGCHAEIERRIMARARQVLGRYADMEDLIRVGAYRDGADPETDAAIRFAGPAERFLAQAKGAPVASTTAFAELYGLLAEAGCDVPLPEMPPEAAPEVASEAPARGMPDAPAAEGEPMQADQLPDANAPADQPSGAPLPAPPGDGSHEGAPGSDQPAARPAPAAGRHLAPSASGTGEPDGSGARAKDGPPLAGHVTAPEPPSGAAPAGARPLA